MSAEYDVHLFRKLRVVQLSNHLLITKHLLTLSKTTGNNLQRMDVTRSAVHAEELGQIGMDDVVRLQALLVHVLEKLFVQVTAGAQKNHLRRVEVDNLLHTRIHQRKEGIHSLIQTQLQIPTFIL